MIIHIDDLNHPGVAVYAKLTDREIRSACEKEGGVFIAESPKVIERALDAGYEPISFLMEERHVKGDAACLLERCPDLPVYTGEPSLLESLTGYRLTRGVLCAFRRPVVPEWKKVAEGARRVAVLENVTDAINMGAIFRSAAALGIDGVLLTPECGDPLSRRCVRVSMGNVFLIPWARLGQSKEEWPDAGMAALKEAGFKTVAMALRKNSIDVRDSLLKNARKLAILLGTEGEGLLEATIDSSDYVVKLPMRPGVDSLNVAAAAAVVFWELGIV